MVDASGLPGICRSNTGVADTDEPCTNRTVPRRTPLVRSRNCLRQRNSLPLSAPTGLIAQCSVPATAPEGASPLVSPGIAAAVSTAAATPKNSRRGAGSFLAFEVTLSLRDADQRHGIDQAVREHEIAIRGHGSVAHDVAAAGNGPG